MSQHWVSKHGKCSYCGSQLRQCIECGEWFIATNKAHVYCRARCRQRRCRLIKSAQAGIVDRSNEKEIDMPAKGTPVPPGSKTKPNKAPTKPGKGK